MSKLNEAVTKPFGTLCWCGIFKEMPAFVGSYYCGATLYVFDGRWFGYATGKNEREVIPHRCKKCDRELPLESEAKYE